MQLSLTLKAYIYRCGTEGSFGWIFGKLRNSEKQDSLWLGYIIVRNLTHLGHFQFISHCPHLKSKLVLLTTPTLVLPLLFDLTFCPSHMSLMAVLDCDALLKLILLMDSSRAQPHLLVNLTFCWQDAECLFVFRYLCSLIPNILSTHPKTFGRINKG